jgi:recombination associated protein RdgC
MFPRNLTVYRIGAPPRSSIDEIEAELALHTTRDPGPQELSASGFASPYGPTGDRLVVRHGRTVGFTHQLRVRDITARAVNEEVTKRAQKIADDEDRKVGARERKGIRDDVWNELLPRALISTRATRGWIDLGDGWVVIDTRSRQRAENVLSQLREAFGSFPAVRLAAEESPRLLMTHWLATGEMPAGLTLGDECELRDPATSHGAVVRCRRQDLDTDEIREHLRSGKQCFTTGLTFDDRLDLVLAEDLSIRALRPTDVLLDSALQEHESQDAEVENNFALAVLEVTRLLTHLETTFRIPRPEAN